MKNYLKLIRSIGYLLTFSILSIFYSCNEREKEQYKNPNDEAFVVEAHSSNILEIAAGNLAAERGNHNAVKQFGQQMADDHTLVGEEMDSLIQRNKWNVASRLLDKHRVELDSLSALQGSSFDTRFASMMVKTHKEATQLFSTSLNDPDGVEDSDLREFIRATLPHLQHHLELAISLSDSIAKY